MDYQEHMEQIGNSFIEVVENRNHLTSDGKMYSGRMKLHIHECAHRDDVLAELDRIEPTLPLPGELVFLDLYTVDDDAYIYYMAENPGYELPF